MKGILCLIIICMIACTNDPNLVVKTSAYNLKLHTENQTQPDHKEIDTSFRKMFSENYITTLDGRNGDRCIVDSFDFDQDGIKEIVVSGYDTVAFLTKIIVFKKIGAALTILDSSGSIESDGRGPKVFLMDDTLIVTHNFHHGSNTFSFLFNKSANKFKLVTASQFELDPYKPDKDHFIYFDEIYYPTTGVLTLRTLLKNYGNDSDETSKQENIYKASAKKWLNELTDALVFVNDVFEIEDNVREKMEQLKCTKNH